jgi:hypothetical protein
VAELLELLLGRLQLQTDLLQFLGAVVGPLAMAEATGGQIADTAAQGFALLFAVSGLGFPAITAADGFSG